MFEVPTTAAAAGLPAASIAAYAAALTAAAATGAGDAERVDRIRALEVLKCAAAAAQAVLSVDLDESQRAAQQAVGVPSPRLGRGVAAQVALARRESPHRGQQHLGLAKILRAEMPHTMAAFAAGRITEWKATLLARETTCLSLADRQTIDAELAADADRIEAMGDSEAAAAARQLAYRLDPESFLERRRQAEADRRVTLRPGPDAMSQLTAVLPVKDGVAILASLTSQADSLVAGGDARSRGQIMADTLVERVTGRAAACSPAPQDTQPRTPTRTQPDAQTRVDLVINLIVSDAVLFGGEAGSAYVEGFGPIPGDLAREWVTDNRLTDTDRRRLRRLYAQPDTGALVAMDSRTRRFRDGMATLIRLRDRVCRTPWCDAPIRHGDHPERVADGGPTSRINGQGLCAACNYAKDAPGWHARPRPGPRHTVETTTPTGHTYRSTAPPAEPPLAS